MLRKEKVIHISPIFMKNFRSNFNRICSMLIILCLLISALAGCGNSKTPSTADTTKSSDKSTASALTDDKTTDENKSESTTDANETSSTTSTADSNETTTASESIAATTIASETTAAVNKDYLNNIAALPNTSIPYGFGSEVDELNRPTGCTYYKSLYGKYNADFIQDSSSKTIYLTMDEGYEAGYTPSILDTLKAKKVKAVFFVTKQFFDSNPEYIQRMIDEEHTIGNHTCAHPSGGMPTMSMDAQIEDITKLHNLIKDKFNYDMKLFRFPTGTFSEQSLAIVESLGYKSIFWSFAYKDYDTSAQMDPTEALNKCVAKLHPGAIYLLHAVSSTNAQILGEFIDKARAEGYEFGTYPVQ